MRVCRFHPARIWLQTKSKLWLIWYRFAKETDVSPEERKYPPGVYLYRATHGVVHLIKACCDEPTTHILALNLILTLTLNLNLNLYLTLTYSSVTLRTLCGCNAQPSTEYMSSLRIRELSLRIRQRSLRIRKLVNFGMWLRRMLPEAKGTQFFHKIANCLLSEFGKLMLAYMTPPTTPPAR